MKARAARLSGFCAALLVPLTCGAAQPRILSNAEAADYIAQCARLPKIVTDTFSQGELLKDNCQALQTIAMPSGDVYVLVSGLSNVGVIAFDGGSGRIKDVRSWSDFIRESGISVYAFDKATYRLEGGENRWNLIMEFDFYSERRGGKFYRWQFTYRPNSFSAEKRYESPD
jgi:hypothetical protein